jgi:tetratricopeptide (TPR) repeat protein
VLFPIAALMRAALVLSAALTVGLAHTAAHAQMPPTPLPFPTATPSGAAEMPQAAAQAVTPGADAAAQALAAAERAEAALERAENAVDVAANFLGLFEAIGFLVTVGGGLAAVFGITRLFRAERALRETRDEVQAELARTLAEFRAAGTAQSEQLRLLEADLQRARERASRALSFLLLGERQFRAGDNSGAIRTYALALELDPHNPLIHYRLGYVYGHSSQFEQARHHLEAALRIDADFAPALAMLGWMERRIGDREQPSLERDRLMNEAERLLLRALSIAPNLVDENGESWWGSLGGLYKREGNTAKAIAAYERASEVTPQSSYPFSNLALLYMKTGDVTSLTRSYQRVEKLARAETTAEVDNYWGFNDLLTARLALGRDAEARETLEAVLDTVPRGGDGIYPLEALADTLRTLAGVLGPDAQSRFAPFLSQVTAAIEARKTAVQAG